MCIHLPKHSYVNVQYNEKQKPNALANPSNEPFPAFFSQVGNESFPPLLQEMQEIPETQQ